MRESRPYESPVPYGTAAAEKPRITIEVLPKFREPFDCMIPIFTGILSYPTKTDVFILQPSPAGCLTSLLFLDHHLVILE